MRLLIVEDDDRSGGYLVRGLSESGHIADRATDGETGLALALEEIYDVLIVDRRLPGLDGICPGGAPAEAGNCHAGSDAERALRTPPTGWQDCALAATTIWPSHTRSPRCWRGWKDWLAAMTRHAVSPCCASPI